MNSNSTMSSILKKIESNEEIYRLFDKELQTVSYDSVRKIFMDCLEQGKFRFADECLKYLPTLDIDVEGEIMYKCNPLIRMSSIGKFEVVKYLVKNGADVNFGRHNETPIMYAFESGHIEIIKYLYDQGAMGLIDDTCVTDYAQKKHFKKYMQFIDYLLNGMHMLANHIAIMNEDLDQKDDELDKKDDELERKIQLVEQYKRENAALRLQICNQLNELVTLRANNQFVNNTINQLKQANDSLTTKVSDLKEQVIDLVDIITDVSEDNLRKETKLSREIENNFFFQYPKVVNQILKDHPIYTELESYQREFKNSNFDDFYDYLLAGNRLDLITLLDKTGYFVSNNILSDSISFSRKYFFQQDATNINDTNEEGEGDDKTEMY